ncbi:MAG: M48 family metalloprotease [Deltaproteobacteria bacterium]|nr:M48 family metalloprotease [Deltaproteobacteria bacterium]
MFNNIIYFIIVLLLYNVGYPGSKPEESMFFAFLQSFFLWLLFALSCKIAFQRLKLRLLKTGEKDRSPAVLYQALVVRLSMLAILFFFTHLWLFNLKYWLLVIPGIGKVSAVHGLFAVMVFLFYLATIWFFGHPVYVTAFSTQLPRASFVISNIRLNVPILFPWLFLSLVYDLLYFIPWPSVQEFLNEAPGQMVFFGLLLALLMLFMPRVIQFWWGCEPYPASEKAQALRRFLDEKGFRYRHMLKWPIFEGRMLTAGIMGLVPRYRYILVTESLMDLLSIDELKAVLAHEMGHAKHRHLLFYLLFFLGFMVLSFGLFDFFLYFLAAHPFFMDLLKEEAGREASFFYLVLAFPMLLTMLVYFRYVMGFFMRHFERQADLYSARSLGSPAQIINSLEKIAFLSGKIRDLPSWHHFSISERVRFLWRTTKEPGLAKRHNRFVTSAFTIYLVSVVTLGYFLNFSPLKEMFLLNWTERSLQRQIEVHPENLQLYQNLAIVYHTVGKCKEALRTYENLIRLDPGNSWALNNLAWLLATAEEENLRDEKRALVLAKQAVAIESSAMYLDTLAEAYFVNGMVSEAVTTIKSAIDAAKEGKEYYERKLSRFQEKYDSRTKRPSPKF